MEDETEGGGGDGRGWYGVWYADVHALRVLCLFVAGSNSRFLFTRRSDDRRPDAFELTTTTMATAMMDTQTIRDTRSLALTLSHLKPSKSIFD